MREFADGAALETCSSAQEPKNCPNPPPSAQNWVSLFFVIEWTRALHVKTLRVLVYISDVFCEAGSQFYWFLRTVGRYKKWVSTTSSVTGMTYGLFSMPSAVIVNVPV